MKKTLFGLLLMRMLPISAAALELSAPEVPPSCMERMPQATQSLSDGLPELIRSAMELIHPELQAAGDICYGILVLAMLFTFLPVLSERISTAASIGAAAVISAMLYRHTSAMISYAEKTLWEICEYGKLLCPVLTTALAAQGGISSSAVLYAGTTGFITVLSVLVSRLIVPLVHFFLVLSAASCAFGEDSMKKFADAVKGLLIWGLKTLLILFTTYMSVTGAVSGTTDAAALKAAKVTVSSVVPVVGGILSEASESLLVSMGIVKNTAGIYGILAVLAVFAGPFVRIGVQYLLLKVTSALCCLFAEKNIAALVEDFSAAMGILLAMVAAGCVMVLISTVCFLRGLA